MGAFDILNHLRERGVTLTPEPDGNIRVKPGGVLTDTERAEIRAHKPELIDLLRQAGHAPPAPAPRREVLHLVGMTTTSADRLADYFELARRHGFGLDDAEHIADRLQMRDRLLLDMAMCIEWALLTWKAPPGAPRSVQPPKPKHWPGSALPMRCWPTPMASGSASRRVTV